MNSAVSPSLMSMMYSPGYTGRAQEFTWPTVVYILRIHLTGFVPDGRMDSIHSLGIRSKRKLTSSVLPFQGNFTNLVRRNWQLFMACVLRVGLAVCLSTVFLVRRQNFVPHIEVVLRHLFEHECLAVSLVVANDVPASRDIPDHILEASTIHTNVAGRKHDSQYSTRKDYDHLKSLEYIFNTTKVTPVPLHSSDSLYTSAFDDLGIGHRFLLVVYPFEKGGFVALLDKSNIAKYF
jgi:hypothetical protein